MTLNNHTLAYAWAEVKTPPKRKKRLNSQDFVVVALTALKYLFSDRKVVSALVTFNLLFIKHEAWPMPCWQTELGKRCLEEFACHNKASSFITWLLISLSVFFYQQTIKHILRRSRRKAKQTQPAHISSDMVRYDSYKSITADICRLSFWYLLAVVFKDHLLKRGIHNDI